MSLHWHFGGIIMTIENQINQRQTCLYPPFFTTNLSLSGLGLNLGPVGLEVHLIPKNSVAYLTENAVY